MKIDCGGHKKQRQKVLQESLKKNGTGKGLGKIQKTIREFRGREADTEGQRNQRGLIEKQA